MEYSTVPVDLLRGNPTNAYFPYESSFPSHMCGHSIGIAEHRRKDCYA